MFCGQVRAELSWCTSFRPNLQKKLKYLNIFIKVKQNFENIVCFIINLKKRMPGKYRMPVAASKNKMMAAGLY